MSPFERTNKLLKSEGWLTWKVEVFNRWSMRTVDLFNMIDIVAIRPDQSGVLGIQICGQDISPHVHKIMEGYIVPSGKHKGETIPPNPYIKPWLQAGNTFFIWGWRLRKHEGTRDTYQLRELEFILENSEVVVREKGE